VTYVGLRVPASLHSGATPERGVRAPIEVSPALIAKSMWEGSSCDLCPQTTTNISPAPCSPRRKLELPAEGALRIGGMDRKCGPHGESIPKGSSQRQGLKQSGHGTSFFNGGCIKLREVVQIAWMV